MQRRVNVILFWMLIAAIVVGLCRMSWGDWHGSLPNAAFVVPLVLFSMWFRGRFKGSRKRAAITLICSVFFGITSGEIIFWDWMLFRSGFELRSELVEALVAGFVFVVCGSVFIWSLRRLRQRQDNSPA